ncbi:MAG TPA: aldo/keto reductase [Candidatus Kapabacteria bacterium]|nr:aldo/keto reductase [Candidatus Kapabacteria bacterium]
MIPGFATTEGTARFRGKSGNISQDFNALGRTGLFVSQVGFGTYRCDVRILEHKTALAKAIRLGVNLIDSSANYADGNAERLIGEVLSAMIEVKEIAREEIVVVTKGGYIQGENYKRISEELSHHKPDTSIGSFDAELVRYGQGLWHSIHPEFLEDQITRSLDRLQLETIDVYLLHNPEYYIQAAIDDNIPEDEARDNYEKRIVKALAYLETEVEQGRIKWYGISSNTFPKPEESVDRTSLERIWKEVSAKPDHFAVVQLPMNLYERGAILEKNQEKSSESIIEFARKENIGVLINRPLNAIKDNLLIRLSDYPEREFPPEQDINDLVHDLTLQETEFKNGALKDIALNPQAYDSVKKLLAVGEWLGGKRWSALSSFEEWRDLLYGVIKPRLQYVFDVLQKTAAEHREIFVSMQEYAESVDEVVEHITNFYLTKSNERAAYIHSKLRKVLPAEDEEMSLAQKSILMLRSIEGVSSVLVGMRSDEYVDDVLYGLQVRKLENAESKLGELEL